MMRLAVRNLGYAACFASLVFTFEAMAESKKITFLHVNDIYEFLPGDSRGGLAELKTLIKDEKRRNPSAMVTFSGDLLSPSVASSVTQGSHMIEFFNRMDVSAATLGNHEFDFGADQLRQRMKESTFPWVVSNAFEQDGKPFGNAQELRVIEAEGIKVGYFGLLTSETAHMSAGAKQVTFRPEIEIARKSVAALKERGADVIVALTHLDLDEDRKLLREVGGINLILGGHDHNAVILEEDGVLIVKAGENGTHLAVIELAFETQKGKDGKVSAKVRSDSWGFRPTKGAGADPELEKLAMRYDTELKGALDQPLTTLGVPLDSREEMVRGRETAIGNLVADALKSALGADIALINGGSLRGNRQYEAGAVFTRADVLREFPFRNSAVLIEIKGSDLLAALEAGVSKAPAKAGRFPQVAGIKFSYSPAAEPGKRVRKVSVAGKPLQPSASYRLATNSYLADGGDGYEALKKGRMLVDRMSAPILTTLVIDALASMGSVQTLVEGRILETN
ncbi:MAG: 5'-nucleotidase C-terminal domain-containing protein [Alphaproteobacteria bacterium]|nr:5'-nucleotidase C-terminal domain-containing protein [Alphaproteobacteria bacterium]